MFKITTILLSFFLFFNQSIAQLPPIVVAENTLKVEAFGEEVFYFGFAEGDQLIFDFEEVKGKELKEIEILEMPSYSRFMDYKTKKITNKVISINKTGVYKFRLANTGLGGRICKIKIQRIPASDVTRNFDNVVYWRTVSDTAYIPVREKFLVRSDTSIVNVLDQVAKVSSKTAINGNPNKIVVDYSLPTGTIRWSYYIGVGNEGIAAVEEAREKFLSSAAETAVKFPGYGPMAAMALYGINYFSKVQGRDNVKYYFITDWNNVVQFRNGVSFMQYKQGDVINDAYQMKAPLTGKVYLGLENDNIMEAIEVTIMITAIVVNQTWDTRTVQKMQVSRIEEAYLKN